MSTSIPGQCTSAGPRRQNPRECKNQPTRIDNFGTGCGGVGALSAVARREQKKRAGGYTRADDASGCPECQVGASNLGADGRANCNPSNLTRKQEKDTFSRMFPDTQFPMIYVKRRFNYPLRRRLF